MRMKKFFAFGLILLLLAAIQFVAPTNSVPLDNDVGICYVIPFDNVQTEMSYIADATSISAPGLWVLSQGYVEKYSNNDFKISTELPFMTENSQPISQNKYFRGIRLDGLS